MEADPNQLATFHEAIEARLSTKFLELRAEHSNNGRFGMSKAGGCTRAAGLKLLGHEGKPFSGATRLTFFMGHMAEVFAISSLDTLGYNIDGTQALATIDPMMHSYSDGIITMGDRELILSVKSTAYKMSGKRGKTWVRRGFAELPFGGCKVVQPGWWAQMQAEMHGTGRKAALLVVVAKDIVKAFEEDDYLGEKGNGSLAWYCEEIPYDAEWCSRQLIPAWTMEWAATQKGHAGPALYLNNESLRFATLERASTDRMPNAARTGTFSPCSYCDFVKPCAEVA